MLYYHSYIHNLSITHYYTTCPFSFVIPKLLTTPLSLLLTYVRMGTYLENLFQSQETSCNTLQLSSSSKRLYQDKEISHIFTQHLNNIAHCQLSSLPLRPLPVIITTASPSNNFNAEVKHRLLAKEQMLR